MNNIVLPPKGEDILNIINTAGKPLSRSEIADALGLKRLSAGEDTLLETMALNGLIKAERIDHPSPIGYQMMYSSVNANTGAGRVQIRD